MNTFLKLLYSEKFIIYNPNHDEKVLFKFTPYDVILKMYSIDGNVLNLSDLSTQYYYNDLLIKLKSVDNRSKKMINSNWWIECTRDGKTLTNVYHGDKKIFSLHLLVELSNILNMGFIPIHYIGNLSDKQIKLLKLYSQLTTEDASFIFNEKDILNFYYKTINEKFYPNENTIIHFPSKNKSFPFIESIYSSYDSIKKESNYSNNYYWAILLFNEHLTNTSIDNYYFKHLKDYKSLYKAIISKIFNSFVEEIEFKKYMKLNTPKIPYTKNIEQLYILKGTNNFKTRDIIEDEEINKVFHAIMNFYYIQKTKKDNIFNLIKDEVYLDNINYEIDKIKKHIGKIVKVNTSTQLADNMIKYDNKKAIQWDVDAQGNIYPNKDNFYNPDIINNKKKKKSFNTPIKKI